MHQHLAIAIVAVCLINAALSAQEREPARQPVVSDGGASIIIAASKSGKTLYGYSVHTGMWDAIAVRNPDKSLLEPIVGTGLGYVTVDKRIYAFSSATGRWAVVELPGAARPSMSVGDRLRVDVGSKIYMYSAVAGKWAIVDLAADED
jgi:hypothetical protein